jgi:hypothetical protein
MPRQLLSGIRAPASFILTKLGRLDPRGRAGLRNTRFQGQPALEATETRPGSWDDPPRFAHRLYFERDGSWYELEYFLQQEVNLVPAAMMNYFNTFRIDPPGSDKGAEAIGGL